MSLLEIKNIHEPLYKANTAKIYTSPSLKCKPACQPAKTLPCECDGQEINSWHCFPLQLKTTAEEED